MSYSKQLDVLQTSLGQSITLKNIEVHDRYSNAAALNVISQEDANTFIDSEYVKSYNFNGYLYVSYVDDIKKYITDIERYEGKGGKVQANPEDLFYGIDAAIIGREDTEYDFAFTVNGYKLLDGRHIKPEDGENSVCLISKQVAELNNLKIGDRFKVEESDRTVYFDMEIVGLFDIPDGMYAEGFGNAPQEMIFVPEGMRTKEFERVGIPFSYRNITAYLNSSRRHRCLR